MYEVGSYQVEIISIVIKYYTLLRKIISFLPLAGSSGDPNASQLIIGNRAVTLGYARDDKRDREPQGNDRPTRRSDRDDRDRETKMKNDWLCDAVSTSCRGI